MTVGSSMLATIRTAPPQWAIQFVGMIGNLVACPMRKIVAHVAAIAEPSFGKRRCDGVMARATLCSRTCTGARRAAPGLAPMAGRCRCACLTACMRTSSNRSANRACIVIARSATPPNCENQYPARCGVDPAGPRSARCRESAGNGRKLAANRGVAGPSDRRTAAQRRPAGACDRAGYPADRPKRAFEFPILAGGFYLSQRVACSAILGLFRKTNYLMGTIVSLNPRAPATLVTVAKLGLDPSANALYNPARVSPADSASLLMLRARATSASADIINAGLLSSPQTSRYSIISASLRRVFAASQRFSLIVIVPPVVQQ